MSRVRLTREEILRRCRKEHSNFYDYKNTVFSTLDKKVTIICPVHGEFNPILRDHLEGKGCRKCYLDNRKYTTEEFIEKAKLIHGDKYDYSRTKYKGWLKKVEIICPIEGHGGFKQRPNNHFQNGGCPICGNIKKAVKKPFSNIEFKLRAKKIHGDKYSYRKTKYKGIFKNIQIYCKKHKKYFEITANRHLNRQQGCPKCVSSKGENMIDKCLSDLKVKFHQEHKFDKCKHIINLPFDFYLPDHNTLIEYDGEQHFRPINFFGGKKGFELRKKLDKIKNNFAKENGYNLIRITYKQFDDIPSILKTIVE